jgi:hypothetical protein
MYAVILYVNASFLDDLEVFVVKFDPKKYELAKDRARKIFSVNDPTTLPREGRFNGGCEHCPFQRTCTQESIDGMPPAPPKGKKLKESDSELVAALQDKVNRRKELALTLKKVTASKAQLEEEIKDELRKAHQRSAKTADWTVSYSSSGGKEKLNIEAMEADGIDLEKYKDKGDPFEILRITFKDLPPDET